LIEASTKEKKKVLLIKFGAENKLFQDRRKIEADLFEGKLRGVAATNALELGIDVGHIDATLHLGFPGSVAR
jgi:ATP-dependent helicase YprA (DUF1998 family)